MSLPPYARRLDVRATRAAFAAGTLGRKDVFKGTLAAVLAALQATLSEIGSSE